MGPRFSYLITVRFGTGMDVRDLQERGIVARRKSFMCSGESEEWWGDISLFRALARNSPSITLRTVQ